ncbi:Hsp20/alpha crystallin family protein [Sinomicrobium weinanense]|uniref:Hsp20/alpha crystallin family protein n=1 Tax=Sinomicrobium weinanense TaxID=2842200 RepID=A0A926JQR4_9FLAO|nr:Hsp20/alpha crystallin family protein [Sinomicrobium weinanense]MBC9795755.1 Hsp20/alpha crystallin family protein [Sinomicrobium weinanense]MBU3121799.1 Hsp20/alpha crystallin family protein [Sinomicrobium weinanense]
MSLIKFNNRLPWSGSGLSRFFDMDDFFRDGFLDRTVLEQPALNVREKEDEFEIELAAPGLSKKDFRIAVENGYLNISAEKEESKEEKDENYTRKEFNYNSFKRSLLLPENVKEEEVKARYENGILKLNLAKKKEAKASPSRAIEVH